MAFRFTIHVCPSCKRLCLETFGERKLCRRCTVEEHGKTASDKCKGTR